MAYIRAMLILVSVNLVLTEEQHCSKYDFFEKVLEKLVRMEFNEKQKQVDFERINSNVVATLEKMESFSTNVKHEMDLKVAENDLKIAETVSKVDETVALLADNTSKVLNDLEKEFAKLEKQIADKLQTLLDTTQTVAFKARLSSDIDLTVGQTIRYPVVMFNTGNGYDSSTGVFTSPLTGTYMFDIVLCPHHKKNVNVAIVVDNEQTTVVTFYGDANHQCYSANAIVVLQYKQQVQVKVITTYSGTVIDQDSNRWNTFSGALM